MLAKCVNCEFYITPKEKFCRNCGISSPAEDLQSTSDHAERNLTIILTLISSIVCGFGFTLLRNDGDFGSLGELPFAILFSLVPCFLFSILFVMFVFSRLEKKERRRRLAYQKVDLTLNDIQDTIAIRNYELNERYLEIEELLAQTVDAPDIERKEKLEESRQSVAAQIALYSLHTLKIDLFRLQNELMPVFYEKNPFENKNISLEKVDQTLAEIENIRQSLTDDNEIEFPADVLTEEENFLTELKAFEASCQKLRESLLNRRDASALADIAAPVFFKIKTKLDDFSASFETLESKYNRLKAEDKIGQEFSEA